MRHLTPEEKTQIQNQFGGDEFKRFQAELIRQSDAHNKHCEASERIDYSEAENAFAGELRYHGYCFEFAYEPGNGRNARIAYRFHLAAVNSENGKTAEHADPRNTPLMRYDAEILGSGLERGEFQFLWDGDTTEELAGSLLDEFIDWVDALG